VVFGCCFLGFVVVWGVFLFVFFFLIGGQVSGNRVHGNMSIT